MSIAGNGELNLPRYGPPTSSSAEQPFPQDKNPLMPDFGGRAKVVTVENEEQGYPREELLKKIVNEGEKPIDYITRKVAEGVRVINIGELHALSSHMRTLTDTIDGIQKRHNEIGDIPEIGTIAMEIDQRWQRQIEKYLESGKYSDMLGFIADCASRTGARKYIRVLNTIRRQNMKNEHKIKVACINPYSGFTPRKNREREAIMHKKALDIALEDPTHITLIYQGGGHTMKFHDPSSGDRDILPHTKLSDVLGPDKYLSIIQTELLDLPREHMPFQGKLLSTDGDERLQHTIDASGFMVYGHSDAVIFRAPRSIWERVVTEYSESRTPFERYQSLRKKFAL